MNSALFNSINGHGVVLHTRDDETKPKPILSRPKGTKIRDIPYYKTELPRELTLAIVSLGHEHRCQMGDPNRRFLFFGDRETGIKTLMAHIKTKKHLKTILPLKTLNPALCLSSLLCCDCTAQLKKQQQKAPILERFRCRKDHPYTGFSRHC